MCQSAVCAVNTGPYTVLPDNSILITANVQSEAGFSSSHQLKSYVASKSRLKLAARTVLSADAGLLVLSLTVEALQGKTCQDSLLSAGGTVTWSQDFRGEGVVPGEYFWFLQNETHFAIQQCKLHRSTCRCFDTIPVCDGQTDGRTDRQTDRRTDGIAVANTALAMRALRALYKL